MKMLNDRDFNNVIEQIKDIVEEQDKIEEKEKKANPKNFKNLTPEERKENYRKSYETRQAKGFVHDNPKTIKKWIMRKELEKELSKGKTLTKITKSIIASAQSGNVNAYTAIRDTIGEKPIEEKELEVKGLDINVSFVEPNRK